MLCTMGENCPRRISHHRYDEGNCEKYPTAAYCHQSHHSSHLSKLLRIKVPKLLSFNHPVSYNLHRYRVSENLFLSPVVVPPAPPVIAPPPTAGYVDTRALDNWQEATIILCFTAIGLIYLICSRANNKDNGKEKKPDLARKYLSS